MPFHELPKPVEVEVEWAKEYLDLDLTEPETWIKDLERAVVHAQRALDEARKLAREG